MDSWKVLVGQVDGGVPGGVLQPDVVLGPVLFDQGVLEKQRLDLAIGDDEVKVAGGGDEGRGLGVEVPFLEVATHPLLQVFRLTYVDDGSLSVFEEVASGKVGEGFRVDHEMGASIGSLTNLVQFALKGLTDNPRQKRCVGAKLNSFLRL